MIDLKSQPSISKKIQAPASTVQPSFNKAANSLTDPTSIWIIVNKQHPLSPINYAPSDLVNLTLPTTQSNPQMRAPAADALTKLFSDATAQNIHLQVLSAYRSYDYQVNLYNNYVSRDGQAAADEYSARPGYSEHQTGLAVDIGAASGTCNLDQCFNATPEAQWLASNAYKYGFILRYTADKVDVTGYEYEPWHFRYVGTDLSTEMHDQNIETLEEFFDVTGGSSY